MEPLSRSDISIIKIDNRKLSEKIEELPEFRFWPLVYILYNNKKLYVGETTNLITRFKNHNLNHSKKELDKKLVITSSYFNKSVTLQLEAYLIKYLSGDGLFKLLNANAGLTQHNYYDKASYECIFPEIWKVLKEEHVVKSTIEEVNNSDLFKYSPYKTLNLDQQQAIIDILEGLRDDKKTFFIKGGAGTGKTILAIYLIKLLCTPLANIDLDELDDTFSHRIVSLTEEIQIKFPSLAKELALVVPMTSLRSTLKKVFKNIENLSSKMVISPTDATKGNYKLLIIDEAHRLKRRVNIVNYKSFDEVNKSLDMPQGDELDWILKRSDSRIFFYDEKQSIKPSDVEENKFNDLVKKPDTIALSLKSQIRSKGGDLYSDFINNLMCSSLKKGEMFESDDYEILLVDQIKDLKAKINSRNAEFGLSRLVAGFAWEWKSKKDVSIYDFEIEDIKFRWNTTAVDWINSANAINEVGCIHTTQGYDLEYVGIIFGKEISYDFEQQMIVVRPDQYKDKNGKNGTDIDTLRRFIISIYETLLLRGISGTYIYCCDENLKKYFKEHLNIL